MFIDTSAWVAIYWETDKFHQRADTFWQELLRAQEPLVTTSDVFGESAGLIRRRAGLGQAVAFGEMLLASHVVNRAEVREEDRQEAWAMFCAKESVDLSFIDCTSMASMKRLGIRRVFTFDRDFAAMGFEVVPIA